MRCSLSGLCLISRVIVMWESVDDNPVSRDLARNGELYRLGQRPPMRTTIPFSVCLALFDFWSELLGSLFFALLVSGLFIDLFRWLYRWLRYGVQTFLSTTLYRLSSGTGELSRHARCQHERYELYKSNPSRQTAGLLVRATLRWVVDSGKASFGPAVAIFEVLIEKRQVRNSRILALLSWALRLVLPANEVGWNDYHMLRWQMTGDRTELVQIHQRCQHIYSKGERWSAVWQTAQWMTDSYRKQDSRFDVAMKAVERECGCFPKGLVSESTFQVS
jgi:hypothetical protein